MGKEAPGLGKVEPTTPVMVGVRGVVGDRSEPRIRVQNCTGIISPAQSNAGIIPANITGPRPGRVGVEVRHVDLSDDVRAA